MMLLGLVMAALPIQHLEECKQSHDDEGTHYECGALSVTDALLKPTPDGADADAPVPGPELAARLLQLQEQLHLRPGPDVAMLGGEQVDGQVFFGRRSQGSSGSFLVYAVSSRAQDRLAMCRLETPGEPSQADIERCRAALEQLPPVKRPAPVRHGCVVTSRLPRLARYDCSFVTLLDSIDEGGVASARVEAATFLARARGFRRPKGVPTPELRDDTTDGGSWA